MYYDVVNNFISYPLLNHLEFSTHINTFIYSSLIAIDNGLRFNLDPFNGIDAAGFYSDYEIPVG